MRSDYRDTGTGMIRAAVEYALFLLAVSVVIVGYFTWFFWMLGTSGRG